MKPRFTPEDIIRLLADGCRYRLSRLLDEARARLDDQDILDTAVRRGRELRYFTGDPECDGKWRERKLQALCDVRDLLQEVQND